ncbi:alpha/beta fold hydrolase [Micromonospora sp. DT48]|uniref:alpha/beta fold hydrolase n=1 Tax=Micromonospora sp. DT48 TaxID=3393429 RepID=UPI003CEF5DEA
MDPRPHTVNAGGFTTRYWESTPPDTPRGTIVLVHDGAFGGDAISSWAHVMPLLARHHRVLAPDLLGYGDTDKAVYLDRSPYAFRTTHLAAFCAAVGVDTAHFIGQSFGGSLLLRAVATTTPALPARTVVSICGTGGPWRTEKGITELGRYDGTEEDMRRLVTTMVDDYPGLDDTIRARYANTRKPGHVTACLAARLRHPTMAAPTSDDTWPAPLRHSPIPVHVVEGTRDDLLQPGWSHHFDDLAPHIHSHRMNARHAPNLDQPDTLTDLLLTFLTTRTTP